VSPAASSLRSDRSASPAADERAAGGTFALDQYLRVLRDMGLIDNEGTTREFLADLLHVDVTDRRVLDVGGGNGLHSFYAAIMGAREVVCLDPEAAGSTSGATREFERIQQAVPGLPVVRDPSTLEQYRAAEGFDVIFMNASINHIDEDACMRLLEDPKARETFRRVFAHIGALVKPGGRLVVADCTRHNFFAALGLKNPLCPEIEWHKHQAPELWSHLLLEAGFRNPGVTWIPLYRYGKAVRALSSNKAAAYFLRSFFRLEMKKT
jgi:SAM-dependent methyltransferase